jgi:tRNA pseudouridine 55 synthase
MNGFFWVYKEKGKTSRETLNELERKFRVKGGYEGILDPFAEGLLIVGVNLATRFLRYFQILPKTYLAVLVLGKETDTLDVEGEIIRQEKVPSLSKDLVEWTLRGFVGEYEQLPPRFSALRVGGRRAYEMAREGEEFELKPRKVYVEEIRLLEFSGNKLKFLCTVSSGTYVRALGRDIANRLGTVGYLEFLKRLKIGEISSENAKKVEELTGEDLIPMDEGLYWMEKVEIFEEKFLRGNPVKFELGEGFKRVYFKGRFVGVGVLRGNILKPDRLLPNPL